MAKRIVSVIAVVLLVGIYVATFICALLNTPETQNLFMGCIAMTVLVPIVLWIFLRMYARAHENDDKNISWSEMRKYQKRIKKGEDPDVIAEEIDKKYNKQEDK